MGLKIEVCGDGTIKTSVCDETGGAVAALAIAVPGKIKVRS
jgi:hypothetical protein